MTRPRRLSVPDVHRRRRVRRVEAADGQQEVRIAAPVDPQRHVAGERGDEHARVVERRVELELSLLEVDAAGEVHLQINGRRTLRPATGCAATPRMANAGRGISSRSPISTLMSVGVPHPSLPIGPIRKRSSCGGKTRLRSLMMRGAFATTSVGNRMLLSVPSRTPTCSASSSTVRFSPSRPPTPSSVNP